MIMMKTFDEHVMEVNKGTVTLICMYIYQGEIEQLCCLLHLISLSHSVFAYLVSLYTVSS